MRKRTVQQIDREIKRVEKRLNQLREDRNLLALGIEPRNQLTICIEPSPKPSPLPPPSHSEQLLFLFSETTN
ncbi:MAG: hypothetical protein GY854_16095 [Deltaproteobacteria bacterium]|nr:hypothetical protein [Deltaproteobacteria bacterium]